VPLVDDELYQRWLFPPFQTQQMVDALIAATTGQLLQRADGLRPRCFSVAQRVEKHTAN